MATKKKKHPKIKSKLHVRNKHKQRYDLQALIKTASELAPFVHTNKYGDESIDFFDPKAVKMLNTALLKHYYSINLWDIPEGYLCPPIPGRADYIHYAADLLAGANDRKIPSGKNILCLDIGVGANCVYPIIGTAEYDWSFIGTEADPVAVDSAKNIVANNKALQNKVEIRLQKNRKEIFKGVLKENEKIDIVIANPPFHSSPAEAEAAALKKLNNLQKKKGLEPVLNFGGKSTELWCVGGEEKFIGDMIKESIEFSTSCFWFTSLVSKQTTLKSIYSSLERAGAAEVKTIKSGQGNKVSRIVCWTFLSSLEQKNWAESRWK